jgi:hypothetical protein
MSDQIYVFLSCYFNVYFVFTLCFFDVYFVLILCRIGVYFFVCFLFVSPSQSCRHVSSPSRPPLFHLASHPLCRVIDRTRYLWNHAAIALAWCKHRGKRDREREKGLAGSLQQSSRQSPSLLSLSLLLSPPIEC